MSSMLTSQGLVFATAMAVSAGTIILFDLFKDRYFPPAPHLPPNHDSAPPQQPLKSCLSTGKKRVKAEKNVNDTEKKNKKKKRVHFADDVRETKGNGEVYRREHHRKYAEIHQNKAKTCANEILDLKKMPPNRAALYSGILRDRVQRMGYSY